MRREAELLRSILMPLVTLQRGRQGGTFGCKSQERGFFLAQLSQLFFFTKVMPASGLELSV